MSGSALREHAEWRRGVLGREIDDFLARNAAASRDITSLPAYKRALEFLAEADKLLAESSSNNELFNLTASRRSYWNSLLHAQVEVDKLRHTEVDPNVGWVGFRAVPAARGEEEWLAVDTQLMTIFLDPSLGGAIMEFDYKPRKVNLVCGNSLYETFEHRPSDGHVARPRMRPKREHSSMEIPPYAVLRSTPDTLVLRFREELSTVDEQRCVVVKDVTFRAGIGAHLPNATTGFSVETWLEGMPESVSEELVLIQQWEFVLPSGRAESCRLRPLLCVGGVSERELELKAEKRFLHTTELPGGLYGLRFVDEAESFSMDLRVAKPLHGLSYRLVEIGQSGALSSQCFEIALIYSAKRLRDDEHTNTLYLSIV